MSEADEKRYYLACLDLAGRSCLVVGGGKVREGRLEEQLPRANEAPVVGTFLVEELEQ